MIARLTRYWSYLPLLVSIMHLDRMASSVSPRNLLGRPGDGLPGSDDYPKVRRTATASTCFCPYLCHCTEVPIHPCLSPSGSNVAQNCAQGAELAPTREELGPFPKARTPDLARLP